MNRGENSFDRQLQLAGILIILSLLVEVFGLLWNRPLAFFAYLAVGGLLLGAGVLVYLYSLVDFGASQPNRSDSTSPEM